MATRYFLVASQLDPRTATVSQVPVDDLGGFEEYDQVLDHILDGDYRFRGQALHMGPQGLIEDGQGGVYRCASSDELPALAVVEEAELPFLLGGGAEGVAGRAVIEHSHRFTLDGHVVEVTEREEETEDEVTIYQDLVIDGTPVPDEVDWGEAVRALRAR